MRFFNKGISSNSLIVRVTARAFNVILHGRGKYFRVKV